MTEFNKHPTHRDVTYIGKEDPFEDRNYGSNLQFVPGQTRSVPVALAARFLAHTDCFEEPAKADEAAAVKTAATKAKKEESEPKKDDDTDAVLKKQKEDEDAKRKKQDEVFMLHNQIDAMTKADIVEFVRTNFKETLDMKMAKGDMQAQAKSLVDRFGVA